jgi:acetyl esterase/lipase
VGVCDFLPHIVAPALEPRLLLWVSAIFLRFFKKIARYGGDPDAIFVAGHSAGGYLTSMVGLDKSYLAAHGVDADRIAGLFPYSGQAITHSTIREERNIPREQAVADEFAALRHIRKDVPPLVLITGGRDLELPARYEENALLWRMMRAAGHPDTQLFELEGFDHGTMVAPGHLILLPQVERILSDRG